MPANQLERGVVYEFANFSVVYLPNLSNQVRHYHPALEISLLLSQTPADINWWEGSSEQHRSRPLQPQQICIIPPKSDHAVTGSQPLELLMLHFPRPYVEQIAKKLDLNQVSFSAQYAIDDPFIWQLCRQLHDQLQFPSPNLFSYLDQLISCLLTHLFINYSTNQSNESNASQPVTYPFTRSYDTHWAEATI